MKKTKTRPETKEECIESKVNIALDESLISTPIIVEEQLWDGYSIAVENKVFYPAPNIKKTDKIPPGLFDILWDGNRGSYFLSKREYNTDELLNLPIKVIQDVIKDIDTFWERGEIFKKYKYVYKRGILLWGPPGGGKSCTIQILIENLITKHKGIVFNVSDSGALANYESFMSEIFRQIEPNTPVIVLIEDIDGLCRNEDVETNLINILDGLKQINKVVYVATTNYPEKLKERITNRPSRFDRMYYVGYPTARVRNSYLTQKLKPEDLQNINIKEWVDQTDGLTFAHLRELIISVILLGNTFEETIKHLKELSNRKNSTDSKKRGTIGFGSTSDGGEILYAEESKEIELKEFNYNWEPLKTFKIPKIRHNPKKK